MSGSASGHLISVGIVAHDAGGVGGMETQVAHLAIGLADRGYPVTVVACTCACRDHPGIRWVRIPAPRPMSLRLPWFALAAGRHLAAHRPDVLITTGAIVPQRADLSVVHFCHHGYRHQHGSRRPSRVHPLWRANAIAAEHLSLWAERWCYQQARCGLLVPVSGSTAAELAYIPGHLAPAAVAENGVDTKRFRPRPDLRAATRQRLGLPPGAPVALFVGGDWELKRPGLAVAALQRAEGWHLLVVGPGDGAGLQRQALELGVADRLRVLGRQADPLPYYAAADIFTHPSRSEACSLALLEALACGLGVITTLESTQARDCEAAGAAVRVQATPDALAAALRDCTPARRQAMGTAGRAFAASRDWQRTVDRFERFILARSRMPRPGLTLGSDAS